MWHGAIETHLLYHATNSTPSTYGSDSGRLNFRLDGAVKEHFIWFLFLSIPFLWYYLYQRQYLAPVGGGGAVLRRRNRNLVPISAAGAGPRDVVPTPL